MAYIKDENYEKLLQEAAIRGDFKSAAMYEQQRNEKIKGEGMDYATTDRFSSYLKEKPTYESKYSGDIDSLVDKVMNGSYSDFQSGDDYASLAREYTAKGKKAMQDTVGEVSSRTGGLASSYAVTAGQQTNNAYMAELENMAREMYRSQSDADIQKLGLLQSLESGDYNRYLDLLDQYNYEDSTDYSRKQDEYNKTASIAQTMAGIGDFTGLKAMGYTDAQIKELTDAYKAEMAAGKAGSGSGGVAGGLGGSLGGSYGGTADLNEVDWSAVDAYARQPGHKADDYLKIHYKELGFKNSSEAIAAYNVKAQTEASKNANQQHMYDNFWAIIDSPDLIDQKAADGQSLLLTNIRTALEAGAITDEQANRLINKYLAAGGK